MRRALIGLAVTMFTVLALAGPASAASGQVTQFKFHGTFAEAMWFTSSDTSTADTSVHVSTEQGSVLIVDQFIADFANGTFTETFAEVTSGFSFAIDKALLGNASLSGSGVPATTCTFDRDFNLIGCSATTIDVNVTWTAQGPISRGVFNHHFKSDGFSEIDHFNGTDRDATATGTVGGLPLSASDLEFADLGTTNAAIITICIGTSC
jgi:hypothetical protein